MPDKYRPTFCDKLRPYARSFEICEARRDNDFSTFTFGVDMPEFYNSAVLEGSYDATIVPKSAAWLSEWADPPSSPKAPLPPGENHQNHQNHQGMQ